MEIHGGEKGGLRSVMLENDSLQIALLPELGGKIADLLWKPADFQLAAQPRENYRLPDYGSDFADFDASGLDDGFPCLHPCKDPVSGYDYPDHGEIWSADFDVRCKENAVILSYESPRFPYRYEKEVTLSGSRVILSYRIQNTGSRPFPCIWAFHGLMRYAENMEIRYPGENPFFWNTLDSPLLGPAGQLYAGRTYHFHRVPAKTPPAMVKYYLAEPVTQGRCGFWYPDAGVGCLLHYDPAALPFLGVWITAGGFRGDHNCALEPANGFYDDVVTARQNDTLYQLQPDRPLAFRLELEITEDRTHFYQTGCMKKKGGLHHA